MTWDSSKAIHPNIVKLLGNPTLKDSKWIIPMEFIFGEELETTIFKSQKSKIQVCLWIPLLPPNTHVTVLTKVHIEKLISKYI